MRRTHWAVFTRMNHRTATPPQPEVRQEEREWSVRVQRTERNATASEAGLPERSPLTDPPVTGDNAAR